MIIVSIFCPGKRFIPTAKVEKIQEKIRELLIINQDAGTRSVLDINGISETPELEKATPLPKELLLKIFNTEKPTRDMIEGKKYELAGLCGRLSAICIRVFENDMPVEIYFAGYSAD